MSEETKSQGWLAVSWIFSVIAAGILVHIVDLSYLSQSIVYAVVGNDKTDMSNVKTSVTESVSGYSFRFSDLDRTNNTISLKLRFIADKDSTKYVELHCAFYNTEGSYLGEDWNNWETRPFFIPFMDKTLSIQTDVKGDVGRIKCFTNKPS